MKTEEMLRLQAYLDNEVSSAEARQIASRLARDADAKALYDELKATKELLNPENEAAAAVPDSRQFYWSKIQRAIEHAEREPVRTHAPRPWWIKLLAPLAGAAALGVFVFTSISFNSPVAHFVEHEMASENGTITFRTKDHPGMTLVWISSGQTMAEAEPIEVDEDP
jgi:anti-sigma factor RsiW